MSEQTILFETSISDEDIARGIARGKTLKAEFMRDLFLSLFGALKAKKQAVADYNPCSPRIA